MKTFRNLLSFPFILVMLTAFTIAVFFGLLVDLVSGAKHSRHLFNW